MIKNIHLLLSALILTTCAPFVESPYSDQIIRPERDLHQKSIEQIGLQSFGALLKVALFSDSHQNYKDLEEVIFQMNKEPNLDFIANLGDFTNSSYNMEYDQFLASYVNIKPPTFTAIGNHDSIGAGIAIFQKVFGPANHFFDVDNYRFIFFNTSNLESAKDFDPAWLTNTVNSTTKDIIIFSHIPLNDSERFKDDLAAQFDAIIQNARVKLLVNGHNHVFNFFSASGTGFLQVPRVEGNQWLVIEIQGSDLTITEKKSGKVTVFTLKP